MSSAICFNLGQSKILSSGNGLSTIQPKHANMKAFEFTYLARKVLKRFKNRSVIKRDRSVQGTTVHRPDVDCLFYNLSRCVLKFLLKIDKH